jgi:hypothetical protein
VAIVTVAVVMTSKQAPSTLDITSWFVEWVPQSPSFEEGTAQYDALEWLISEIDDVGEYDEENQLQLFSLAALYFSTDGDNWINGGKDWLSGIVNERNITKLDLSENNLQGRIPAEMGLLRAAHWVSIVVIFILNFCIPKYLYPLIVFLCSSLFGPQFH